MSVLKKAKKLVEKYSFKADVLKKMKEFKEDTACEEFYDGQYTQDLAALNHKVLAKSLGYFIKADAKKVKEKDIPLGASKLSGLPHLPKTWAWPEGYIFYGQLNIGDFKKLDIENHFPSKGIIYFFKEAGGEPEDLKLLFYDGPAAALEMRNHPGAAKHTSRLTFTAHYIFYLGSRPTATCYKEAAKIIPSQLNGQLKKLLKAVITDKDPDRQLLGRPIYWQSEDVYYDADADDDDDDWDPVKFGQMMSREENGWKDTAGHLLLFQDSHGEGHLHCWIKPSDLKKKIFSKVIVTASGT